MTQLLFRSLIAVGLLITFCVQPALAGRGHYGHCHGGGSTAAVAFAIGAVATMLAPPPPPRHIIHHHGPRPYPPYGYYPPPVVQRDIYYVNPPPVIQQVPANPPQVYGQPSQAPQQLNTQQQFSNQNNSYQPPAIAQNTSPGTIVERLPLNAMSETRNGVTYFSSQGVYYLPIQVGADHRFIVVQPN
ncbi:hypothetical protein [uncultured Rubinisphaera sp.]|uniref:hypothetical protein n=1 Tax=uncultured Rubinisphaera sp. TaxID=1678686 RepID=UPI0030DB2674